MPECITAHDLIVRVNAETTLRVDFEDIKNLVIMLQHGGLLEGHPLATKENEKSPQPLWKSLLHNYLFFSIPLLKPEHVLKTAYPYIRPLFSRTFLTATFILFMVLLVMTLQRWDEFQHTFINLISPEGAALAFVTLMAVKLVHEWGHAFTAHRYGVKVPHMGVAFMVMYPVLYTETSAAWTLENRKARIHIGLAGIIAEMVLSTYALLIWHLSSPGLIQSLAFTILALSLTRSLFINLNPFMRFDGYFIFSDWLGIENLHPRSFACARWWIGKTLWGLNEPPPEDNKNPALLHFLTMFGLGMIVYRFFLYTGIAFLVYWLFFKPLGFVLMMVEFSWFIFLPAWREICIWWGKREVIATHLHAQIVLSGLAICLISLSLPIHHTVTIPAVAQAAERRAFFPPENAFISALYAHEGQAIHAGETLMTLISPQLDRDTKLAETDLKNLKAMRRFFSVGR